MHSRSRHDAEEEETQGKPPPRGIVDRNLDEASVGLVADRGEGGGAGDPTRGVVGALFAPHKKKIYHQPPLTVMKSILYGLNY